MMRMKMEEKSEDGETVREKITFREWAKNREKDFLASSKGITLVALVITILFSYDEKLKCSNSKGFLLTTI